MSPKEVVCSHLHPGQSVFALAGVLLFVVLASLLAPAPIPTARAAPALADPALPAALEPAMPRTQTATANDTLNQLDFDRPELREIRGVVYLPLVQLQLVRHRV